MKTSVDSPIVGFVWNRYNEASGEKDAVIEIRIYYRRKTKYHSTRIRVFEKEWKHGRVVNRVDAMIINKQLDQYLVDIREIIYEMYKDGYIDIDAIFPRLEAKRKPNVSFLDFCEERMKIRKYGKAKDSQERYNRFFRFLKEYGKIKTFYDMTDSKVMELDRFLKKKNMKAKSRWNNYHRFLNSFILDAQKEGLIKVNPYDRVKIEKGDDYDGIEKYLTPEEFQQLRGATMPDTRLERVRDIFVFQVFTCLSYHDLKSFDSKKIKEVDDNKVYFGRRGKTKIEYTIPLLSPSIEILEKYNGKLPLISNVKYNEYLKEVAAAAGINKPITTRWARHTGATLLLNSGVKIEIVSKICGHSSIKMTEKIYAKMLPKTVVSEVTKIEGRLV